MCRCREFGQRAPADKGERVRGTREDVLEGVLQAIAVLAERFKLERAGPHVRDPVREPEKFPLLLVDEVEVLRHDGPEVRERRLRRCADAFRRIGDGRRERATDRESGEETDCRETPSRDDGHTRSSHS